jgi:hypothetical protein
MNWIEYFIVTLVYTLTNIGAALLIPVAIWWPRIVRVIFSILFGWACWFNLTTLQADPGSFLAFANTAVRPYALFINGWFADNLQPAVMFIAIGQGLIAVGLLLKGIWVKLAVWGAVIFLIAISPLGTGSAFPFPLVLAITAGFVLLKDDFNYPWVRREKPGAGK